MTFQAQLLCLAYMAAFGTDSTNHHQACEYSQVITEVGSMYSIEPELIMAIIKKESNFVADIGPNKAGACGLGQQIPVFTKHYSTKQHTCSAIKKNPNLSILLVGQAVTWLEKNYTMKEGTKIYSDRNLKWTLCMYNSGPKSCPATSWRSTTNGTSYARSILKDVEKIKSAQEDIEAYLMYP